MGMAQNTLNAVDTSTHKKWCKCLHCSMGKMNVDFINSLPPVGSCQQCHKRITANGQPCQYCGFHGRP